MRRPDNQSEVSVVKVSGVTTSSVSDISLSNTSSPDPMVSHESSNLTMTSLTQGNITLQHDHPENSLDLNHTDLDMSQVSYTVPVYQASSGTSPGHLPVTPSVANIAVSTTTSPVSHGGTLAQVTDTNVVSCDSDCSSVQGAALSTGSPVSDHTVTWVPHSTTLRPTPPVPSCPAIITNSNQVNDQPGIVIMICNYFHLCYLENNFLSSRVTFSNQNQYFNLSHY